VVYKTHGLEANDHFLLLGVEIAAVHGAGCSVAEEWSILGLLGLWWELGAIF
jgi:hypothetical protein